MSSTLSIGIPERNNSSNSLNSPRSTISNTSALLNSPSSTTGSMVSMRSAYSPLTAKNTIVPLKNINAKKTNNTIKNFVNSKEKAKNYVARFCSKTLVNKVRNSKISPESKAYYQKACDLAGIAKSPYTVNKGPIAASPTFAQKVLKIINASPSVTGGKRKTRKGRKHRKHRKGTRRH